MVAAVVQAVRPRIAWILAILFAAVAVSALMRVARYRRGPEPLAFHQLNFRPEAIFQAAFAADKDTVVYSAATSGNTPQISPCAPTIPSRNRSARAA